MSTDLSFLEPVESRHDTANNTLNNTATQTIMSNLNTSNPVEVTGVMDNLSRVHLVWIENGSQPLLQYALIQTNYGPLGVDTVLISNTLIGYKNFCCMRYGLGYHHYDDGEQRIMFSIGLSAFPEARISSGL